MINQEMEDKRKCHVQKEKHISGQVLRNAFENVKSSFLFFS